MSEDKLTIGSVVFGASEDAGKSLLKDVLVHGLGVSRTYFNDAGELTTERVDPDAFHKQSDDLRQQLAARLGCDVEAVTVENLVNLKDALEDMWEQFAYEGKSGKFSGGLSALEFCEGALAPFKREVG